MVYQIKAYNSETRKNETYEYEMSAELIDRFGMQAVYNEFINDSSADHEVLSGIVILTPEGEEVAQF